MARSTKRIRYPPASITRASGRSTPGCMTSAGVTFLSATDDEALNAFQLLSKLEGIIPALEPAHAIAKVLQLAPQKPKDHLMVVNLSGRGDKDSIPWRGIWEASRNDRTDGPALRRAEAGRPRGADDFHHGGRSGLRRGARDPQGAAESRRRHRRDRHAVHRSDGGRPERSRLPGSARSNPART